MKEILLFVAFLYYFNNSDGYRHKDRRDKLKTVFSWKYISYDFDQKFLNSTDKQYIPNFEDNEEYYKNYKSIPIGLEAYGDRVFVTVPRRTYGVISTLNYVTLSSSSPRLKPYPGCGTLVSTYRPRVDCCGRLWVVDTGFFEVPSERKQIQPPAILVFDLKTDQLILKYELKSSDLVNERSPAGLTSITVDVTPDACDDAFAYINDLATEGLIVFSMKERDSWRISDDSFRHDEKSVNFTVAGYTIPWKDGLFSIALSGPNVQGKRTAFYHPLVSTQEFAVDTSILKSKISNLGIQSKVLGSRGRNTQSGSHDYHQRTNTLLFANVAQDAILCWNVNTELTPNNVAIVAQDHEKLIYISDLKVIGDDVWVLANKIPLFIYSTVNTTENNFYIHRGRIQDLIRETVCDCGKKK